MAFANMYDHLKLHVATASIVFQLGMFWVMVSHFTPETTNQEKTGLCHLNLYYFPYCHVQAVEQFQGLKTMD